MQGEHLILIAKSRHKLFSADSLGREKYSFFKHKYKQMIPEPLQSIPAFPISTKYMQLLISSSSDKRKLLEFKMLI